MASYDFVNYSLRPNKAVERKLMFEILAALGKLLDYPKYRYVGLGSMWFVDFVMAHKLLSIQDMHSIEGNMSGVGRAVFNKPYSCVNVIGGETTFVLPKLALQKHESIIWLDYDSGLEGPVLADLEFLCRTAKSGSIVIASVNAHSSSLPKKDANDANYATDRERLYAVAGDLVPSELPLGAMTMRKFPSFVSTLLFAHIRSSLRKAGRDADTFVPLFNLEYKDNAPMLTVGGAILAPALAGSASELLASMQYEQFASETNSVEIGVPPLTFKEKASLDQLMPSPGPLAEDQLATLGFALKQGQLEAYRRFYRYYPTFGEIAV